MAVGNGCSGNQIGVCGGERDKYETEYLLGTAFINPPLKDNIRKTCDLDNITALCGTLLNQMHDQIG